MFICYFMSLFLIFSAVFPQTLYAKNGMYEDQPPAPVGHGLKAQYFQRQDLSQLAVIRIDGTVSFDWKNQIPAAGLDKYEYSVRWTGQVQPRYSEVYTFITEMHGGVRLWINGQLIIDRWEAHNHIEEHGTITLEAGKRYDIQMEYTEENGVGEAQLYWSSASQNREIIPSECLYPIGVPNGTPADIQERSIKVVWGSIRFATSYEIEVDGVVMNVGTDTAYPHLNLFPGTRHTYRLRAISDSIVGEWSPLLYVNTLLRVPEWNQHQANETEVLVKWADVEGANSYDLEVDGVPQRHSEEREYTHGNLLPGTLHIYRIRANSDFTSSEWSESLQIWTLPAQVTNVTTQAAETTITLSWEPVTGADSYEIDADGSILPVGTHSYIHESLIPGTVHSYRIRAKNSSGVGQWSEEITCQTIVGVVENLRFTVSDTEVNAFWDPVLAADSYDIEINGEIIESVQSPFRHDGLLPGTEYTYRVRAKNQYAAGKWNTLQTVWTLPGIPVFSSSILTSTSIQVSWEPVTGATGYDIEVYGNVINNGANTTYIHDGLHPNTQLTYKVRAKNASGAGGWSSILAETTLPGVPTDLQGQASDAAVTLAWDAMAGATGYDIEIDGSIVHTDSNSYIHKDLLSDSKHTYRVRAKNAKGASQWSGILFIWTLPSSPQNLKARAGDEGIVLTWDKLQGEITYELEVDGAIVSVGASTQYTHTGVEPGTRHIYRIRARHENRVGAWSQEVTSLSLPDRPVDIAWSGNSVSIRLEWSPVQGAAEYEIEVDGTIRSVGENLLFIHDKLIPNTVHYYRIRGRNEAGAGQWSDKIEGSTVLDIPRGLKTDRTEASIRLTWETVPGATGYDVYADDLLIADIAATTYVHSGLLPDSMHVYRVRAKVDSYAGAWSEKQIVYTMLPAPKAISAESLEDTITLHWEEIPGASGYEVEIDGITCESNTHEFIHPSLAPDTVYTYRIRAVNDRGASLWSEYFRYRTTPGTPEIIDTFAASDTIMINWTSKSGASRYEIEVDGKHIASSASPAFVHEHLDANTMHTYRVRSCNEGGASRWSKKIKVVTSPVLMVPAEKDNFFDMVAVVPAKVGVHERKVTITYNSEELQAVDLYTATRAQELSAGAITGTPVMVSEFTPGRIVLVINSHRAVISGIKFVSLVNGTSRVTYTVK